MNVHKKCPVCGRGFMGKETQTWCSRHCHGISRRKEYREARAAEEKAREEIKTMSISEIMLAAREKGMTYGQYVQYLKMQ